MDKAIGDVWAGRIMAQRGSGLTQKAWCEREGLSPNTLQGWVRRLGLQKKGRGAGVSQARAFVKMEAPCEAMREGSAAPAFADGMAELSVVRLRLPAACASELILALASEGGF